MSISDIDRHQNRKEIIKALKDGMGAADIMRKYQDPEVQLTPGKLKTYAKRHLPAALFHPVNRDRARAADVAEALDDIEEASALLLDAADQARENDAGVKEKTAVAAEMRQLALARGRVGGWLQNNIKVEGGDDVASRLLLKFLVAELAPVEGGMAALERAMGKVDASLARIAAEASGDVIEGETL